MFRGEMWLVQFAGFVCGYEIFMQMHQVNEKLCTFATDVGDG
jgi:hypothetical protein